MAQPRTDPLLPQNYRFPSSVDYGELLEMDGGGGVALRWFALRCCSVLCWMRQEGKSSRSVRDDVMTHMATAAATGAEWKKRRQTSIEKDKKKSKSRGVVESNPRPSTAYYYSSYTFQVPSCAAEQQVLQR